MKNTGVSYGLMLLFAACVYSGGALAAKPGLPPGVGEVMALAITIDEQPAQEMPGPVRINGDILPVELTVTNVWGQSIRGVELYFSGQVICEIDRLDPQQSETCSTELSVQDGQQTLLAEAGAKNPGFLRNFREQRRAYYHGVPSYPQLETLITLNGQVTGEAPGPILPVTEAGEWQYSVTNTALVVVTDISIFHAGLEDQTVAVCQIGELHPGDNASCGFSSVLQEGLNKTEVRVVGSGPLNLDFSAEISAWYQGSDLNRLSASPRAVPAAGPAPLAVTFTPEVITNNAIERYEWDFEGDGIFERSETVGRNQSFTYRNAGVYEAALRVTDNRGEKAVGTVTVNVGNEPPVITRADASPSNGESPLLVSFHIAAMDTDGVATIELDTNGDGDFDMLREVSGSSVSVTLQQAYDSVGSYRPVVKVADTLGAETISSFPTLDVRALPPGSPSVALSLSPQSGNAPVDVTLNAPAISPDGADIVTWDWDINGDGQFDLQTQAPTTTYRYTRAGVHYPRVRVTDENGMSAEDVARLTVNAQLDLSLSTDTLDMALNETVSVQSQLSGTYRISVVIERPDGSPVTTLVPWMDREAGQYSDSWGGTDESGNPVKEGQYRAILLYELDGAIRRLDLGTSTGGSQYNPSRSRIPRTFSPLAGEPLEITFTLNRASEVTSFMGLFRVNTRLVTFHQRQSLGRGTHRVLWSGEDDNGAQLSLPSGESFLFGIWGWTLPDNAIYVRSGAHIDSLTVTPRVLTPSSRPDELSNKYSVAAFVLNKPASVRLTVDNAETGVRVHEFLHAGLDAGQQSVRWDGYNDDGDRVAPGLYRIGITPVDENDFSSTTRYIMQQVYY